MSSIRSAKPRLRAYALSLPEAWLDHPWGEDVVKVGKKVFVFFGRRSAQLQVGVKLPKSLLYARSRKFVHPFGYNMDRHGWVMVRFDKDDDVRVELLRDWIAESYEAVASKDAVRAKPASPAARPKTQRSGSPWPRR